MIEEFRSESVRALARTTETARLTDKIAILKEEMGRLEKLEVRMIAEAKRIRGPASPAPRSRTLASPYPVADESTHQFPVRPVCRPTNPLV